jgi:hypothetical protein
MVRAPYEHSPEELIQKAAEARLKVADLSKKERQRLTALRELSKMAIEEYVDDGRMPVD